MSKIEKNPQNIGIGVTRNKIVYLSDGTEAELQTQYLDGNRMKYVVKVFVRNYYYDNEDHPIYEDIVVPIIYERLEDTPKYLEQFELNKEIDNLKQQKNELLKQINELIKPLKKLVMEYDEIIRKMEEG
jgi:hypothetical protein